MRRRAERAARPLTQILLTFFKLARNFFRATGVSYPGQHTTGWPPSVRLAGLSPKGEQGGGTTWPASHFLPPVDPVIYSIFMQTL
jgi:hypothetical protein